jgi:membrane protein DedA with SNARE-associated domain
MVLLRGEQAGMHEFFREYLEAYGYLFLFIGTFLEGEAVLILAGFFAFQGTLSLPGVIGTALAGSFLGDQFYFFLGRWRGKWLLGLFATMAKKFRRALRLIEKYGSFVAFISRYTYGLRIVLPIILGMTNISRKRFLLLNLLSATSWAILFSCAGYFFGKSASLFIDDLDRYEPYLVLSLLLIIGCFWFAHFLHVRWLGRHARSRLERMRVWRADRAMNSKNNESKENTSE